MQLVINTPGTFITQKDGIFRFKQEEKKFDISPRKVESILLTNKAMLSTQAVNLALEHNIDIIFLDGYGDPVGRIWFSKLGSTALIRRRQLDAEVNQEIGLDLVREMISQKINNQVQFLKKLMYARPGKESLFQEPLAVIERALTRYMDWWKKPVSFQALIPMSAFCIRTIKTKNPWFLI